MALEKIVLFVAGLVFVDAANILVLNTFSAKSHYISIRPIGIELARRGHNVTVITSYKEPNLPSNYKEVMVDNVRIWEILGVEKTNVFDMMNKTVKDFMDNVLWTAGVVFTEVILKSTEVQDFLNKDNTFDLVISEQFILDAMSILAYKYKAPLVLFASAGNCMKHNLVTGNPLQLNNVVFEYLMLRDSTSLWGRLVNICATAYEFVWWKYWYLKKHEALIAKYVPDLDQPVPSLFEVQKNVSLMLINSHFSFNTPMAYLPNIVEVGGIHLTPSENTLPKDLQDILDNSKPGVIYMNFGTNVLISEMDSNKKNAFLKVFSKLKETVLMKWEEDILLNKPDNVITRKWFPQKEIFEHPNVKVFISHGGLIGTQEAIFNGIPILGIPVFLDQYNNVNLIQKIGFGKVLDYNDIDENTLENALKEILNNESYKVKAKEVSRRFQDRPMSPLDTAMWWIEYVIRHKGAEFIKNPARHLRWTEYLMIDIYLLIIVTILAVLFLIAIVVLVYQQLFRSQDVKKMKKKRS